MIKLFYLVHPPATLAPKTMRKPPMNDDWRLTPGTEPNESEEKADKQPPNIAPQT